MTSSTTSSSAVTNNAGEERVLLCSLEERRAIHYEWNKDKRIGCVVQDSLSTLISPSLLGRESFLNVSMKQNANNWCSAGVVDAQQTEKGKGITRRYPEQGV